MDEYKFADAAAAVLTANEAQLRTAQRSLVSLNKVITHFDKQSQALPEPVNEDIHTVLVGAAEEAVKRISMHFTGANQAAIDAAEVYRHVGRSVYLRITPACG